MARFKRAMAKKQTRELGIRSNHPGRGVALDDIFAIYDKAELGLLRDLYDLYDDIAAKDLTLSGLIETRTGAILGCKIAISPGGTSDDDKRLAREFEEMLLRSEIDLFELVDHHQYSTLVYGFAASELIWQRFKGRYDIKELIHPRSRSFRVATEINRWLDGAGVDELILQVDDSGTAFERLVDNKWLITRRMRNKLIIAHSGMMYQTAPMSAMKMDATIDWMAFIGRFGLPFPLIRISSWEDHKAIESAERSMATLGSTDGLIVTHNDNFELHFQDGAKGSRSSNSDLHGRFCVHANIEMAKYWVGGYLVSEQGSGAGSYAQANVHGQLRGNLIDHDKVRNALAIRWLCAIWKRVNELRGRLPNVSFYPSQVAETANAPKMAKEMKEAGAPVDKAQLYELTGFRPPESKDQETEEQTQ